uniref:Uncharacterized protein n=1 Tax=Ixodes ricinus TaxID=34613 RepID=A0A0K8RND6_IXORI
MISGLRVLNFSMHRIAPSTRLISTTTGLKGYGFAKCGLESDTSGPLSSPSGLKRVSYARVKKTQPAGGPAGGFRPLKDTSCKEPGTKNSD